MFFSPPSFVFFYKEHAVDKMNSSCSHDLRWEIDFAFAEEFNPGSNINLFRLRQDDSVRHLNQFKLIDVVVLTSSM